MGLHILWLTEQCWGVRDNWFIPWDDIDIFIQRKDYEKLERILREEGFRDNYLSFGILGDNGFPYPFIKIMDPRYRIDDVRDKFQLYLWIDIFPLDYLPADENSAKETTIKTGKYMNLLGIEITARDYRHDLKYVMKKVLTQVMGGYRGITRYIDGRAQKIN